MKLITTSLIAAALTSSVIVAKADESLDKADKSSVVSSLVNSDKDMSIPSNAAIASFKAKSALDDVTNQYKLVEQLHQDVAKEARSVSNNDSTIVANSNNVVKTTPALNVLVDAFTSALNDLQSSNAKLDEAQDNLVAAATTDDDKLVKLDEALALEKSKLSQASAYTSTVRNNDVTTNDKNVKALDDALSTQTDIVAKSESKIATLSETKTALLASKQQPATPEVKPDADATADVEPAETSTITQADPKPIAYDTSVTKDTLISTNMGANTYPWGQCTWYVKNLCPWVGNYWGNALDWEASASASGFVVNSTPAVGSVAVFAPGAAGASGYGHVAVVTAIIDNDTIEIYEGNVGGIGVTGSRLVNISSAQYVHSS